MREISTEKIGIGEHVMIDGVEYMADKVGQDNTCIGCALFDATTSCSDFIGCDGIKFKKVEKKPKYRHYTNTEEMIADWEERFKPTDWPSHSMPLIWVKFLPTSQRALITAYNIFSVVFGETREDLGDLFDNYTYLDGSPCGKKI